MSVFVTKKKSPPESKFDGQKKGWLQFFGSQHRLEKASDRFYCILYLIFKM